MDNSFIDKLIGNLNVLNQNGTLKNKTIVIFGANNPGDTIIEYLHKNNYKVSAVIDSNQLNENKSFFGAAIYLPDHFLKNYIDNLVVLISSRYYEEMRVQLENKGYKEGVHIFKVLDMGDNKKFSIQKSDFDRESAQMLDNISIYLKFANQYGRDTHIFVNPVKANGDMYIISMYFKQFLKLNHIGKYILVVAGKTCKRIAQMFQIENIVIADFDEIVYLSSIERISGQNTKIKILQPYWQYTSILNHLDGYKGLNFNDFYKYCVFELQEDVLPEKPKINYDISHLQNIFESNQLKKGKTVVLSPYANSLPKFNLNFWNKLASCLKGEGYDLCTNCAGKNENPIEGTVPVFFPIEEAIAFIEYAGCFIGIRSGLCEVISSAKAEKFILYPDKSYGAGSVIDLYGLKNLGLCQDATEIIYNEKAEQEILGIIQQRIARNGTA